MRVNLRISFLVLLIIFLSLGVLSILMHFKYHSTRSELINGKYNVIASDMKWAIDRSLKLGISLSEIKNTEGLMVETLKRDDTIRTIGIFKIDQDEIVSLFESHKELTPNATILKKIYANIQSSKKDFWSFDAGGDLRYVGITFKNALQIPIGGIYMTYPPSIVNKAEHEEIRHIYERFLLSIVVALFVSFIIGYTIMAPLSKNLSVIDKNVAQIYADPSIDPDLAGISSVELRRSFFDMFRSVRKTARKCGQIEKWIDGFK